MSDERLVGIWVHESQANSPDGAGGLVTRPTVMTMELTADGAMRQWTQSVAGWTDGPSDSGRQLDFDGQWRADGQTLSVMGKGMVDFMPAAAYEFSGGYLVTHNDEGRLIWRRRGQAAPV